MTHMDFTRLFYDRIHDRESLLDGLDSLLRTESHVLTVVPYFSKNKPQACFKASIGNRTFDVVDVYDNATLFDLVFKKSQEHIGDSTLEGKFFVCEHPDLPGVFTALTIESAEFVRRAFLPYFEQNRSLFYLTFIRHFDLLSLLRNFRTDNGYSQLNIVRASLIGRFEKERGETIIPWLSWPNLELDDAFRYAQEQNGWFRSLRLEASKQGRAYAEITIQRNGVTKTNREFSSVFKNLVLPICDMIHRNIQMFSRRSRRENPNLRVRPLTIEFERDHFDNLEENKKFIAGVRRLANASISVMHGNPYISMSVIDYMDGSTFDLWVLSPREVVIVPQLTSSIASIKRLISCIFDNYAEGSIRDFEMSMV